MLLTDHQTAGILSRLQEFLYGGVHLYAALRILEGDGFGKITSGWAKKIRLSLEEGGTFYEACRNEGSFPKSVLGWIQAGEATGDLEAAMKDGVRFLEDKTAQKEKLLKALFYPSFLLFSTVGVFLFSSTFVIPEFQSLFQETGQALPLITRLIFGMASGLKALIPAIVAVSFLIFFGFPSFKRKGLQRVQDALWSFPSAARVARVFFFAKWGPLMEGYSRRGFSILDSIQETALLFSSEQVRKELLHIAAQVREGCPLSQTQSQFILTPSVRQILKTGEETGCFTEPFSTIARIFKKDRDDILKKLLAVLGPALILLIGVFIALLALGLVLPIFDFNGGLA